MTWDGKYAGKYYSAWDRIIDERRALAVPPPPLSSDEKREVVKVVHEAESGKVTRELQAALNDLIKRGLIVKVGGRYYVPEHAPAGSA